MIAFGGTATAQISEGFEPSGQGSLSVRDELIMNNWLLPDMDVNAEGATPITGATSMCSGPSYKPDQNTGIVTPFLNFASEGETVSFKYSLHRIFGPSQRRWFLVYVGNESSQGFLVDSVEVPSSLSVINYSKLITGFSGNHVVYINVKGDGGNSKFIIDDLTCTASSANVNHPANLVINGMTVGGANPSENPDYVPAQHLNTATANLHTPTLNTASIGDGRGFNMPSTGSNGSVTSEVAVYPNPANNQVNLKFSSESEQYGQVDIYNINGAKIMSLPTSISTGVNTVNINTADLTAGNYIVSLVTNEGTTNKRFTRVQ